MTSPTDSSSHPSGRSSHSTRAAFFTNARCRQAFRLIILPLVFGAVVTFLAILLLNDLRRLGTTTLTPVGQNLAPDGTLIVTVKDINPNNGVATLDLAYIADDLGYEQIKVWMTAGRIERDESATTYDRTAEFRQVPVLMESPHSFVADGKKRVTFKEQNAEIRIARRTPGYWCPFDRYDVELTFVMNTPDDQPLRPQIWCNVEDSHFVHSPPMPLSVISDSAIPIPNSLSLALERPIYGKMFMGLSLLMGLGCVLWTLYKVTYTTVTGMEAFSLLAFDFSVLMAVPALRSVFVPSNLQFALLFDFFVVLIWTAGLLTLAVNIYRHDFMVQARRASAESGQAEPVLPFPDRRDPANRTQSIMSRRAS